MNLNGDKESNELAEDDSYPTLTISTETDQQEDSCCEVLNILFFNLLVWGASFSCSFSASSLWNELFKFSARLFTFYGAK